MGRVVDYQLGGYRVSVNVHFYLGTLDLHETSGEDLSRSLIQCVTYHTLEKVVNH